MDLKVTFQLQILRLFLPSPTYQTEPKLFIGFFKALHNSTPLDLSILISHFIPVQLLFFPPTTFSSLRPLTQFLSSLPTAISSYLTSPYSTYHNARHRKQVLFPLKIYSPFKILVEKVCPKILFVQWPGYYFLTFISSCWPKRGYFAWPPLFRHKAYSGAGILHSHVFSALYIVLRDLALCLL